MGRKARDFPSHAYPEYQTPYSMLENGHFLTNQVITGLSRPYLNNVDIRNHAAYVSTTGGVIGIALSYAAQLSKALTII